MRSIELDSFERAIAMPSYPTLTSVIFETPFFLQSSISELLIRREALAISGVFAPEPAQKSLRPPPVPVLSTIGVLKAVERPNSSATTVEKG